jgi:hypothetical protein
VGVAGHFEPRTVRAVSHDSRASLG